MICPQEQLFDIEDTELPEPLPIDFAGIEKYSRINTPEKQQEQEPPVVTYATKPPETRKELLRELWWIKRDARTYSRKMRIEMGLFRSLENLKKDLRKKPCPFHDWRGGAVEQFTFDCMARQVRHRNELRLIGADIRALASVVDRLLSFDDMCLVIGRNQTAVKAQMKWKEVPRDFHFLDLISVYYLEHDGRGAVPLFTETVPLATAYHVYTTYSITQNQLLLARCRHELEETMPGLPWRELTQQQTKKPTS